MSIDSNMIQENDAFEEQSLRANLELFIVAQEAETLRCQQLRERTTAANRSSATRGNSANSLTSGELPSSRLTIKIPPKSDMRRLKQSTSESHASTSNLAGSPNVSQSRDHLGSTIKMISKDKLPLFKHMPWLTNAIVTPFEKIEEYGVQGVVSLIEAKERTLFTGERSNVFYEKMLSAEDSISTTARLHKADNVEKSEACNSLLLYRLVDVVSFACGDAWTETTVPRQKFAPFTIPGWYAFCNDWPRFVREAGTLIYQVPEEVDGLVVSPQTDITIKHLESVCQRVARMDKNKILINFELAALHLSLLLQGKDYPDNVSELACLGLQKLEEITSRAGTHGLRFPLHLALVTSPCVLLLQTMLHKQEVGRLNLIEANYQTWQSMGGMRPQQLKEVELSLWQVIITLAGSPDGITLRSLKTAFEQIDSLLARGVDLDDIDWFDGAHIDHDKVAVDARNDLADAEPTVEVPSGGSGGQAPPPQPVKPLKRRRSPGGSVTNPIDLTSERQIYLNGKICELIDLSQDKEEMPERSLTKTTTAKPRVTGPPCLLYDVFGEAVPYTPSFHNLADLDVVTQLMRRVEQDFHSSGQPLHVADPARSMFRIMTLQQLNQMEDKELQYLHAHHHLLVTGYPQPPYGFDAKGLAILAPPSRVFTIHDYSIPITDDENQRHQHGTTSELLQSYQSVNGKILNALDFPLNIGSHPPIGIASDLLAFRAMACKAPTDEYPTTDMRWGLAATQGAFTGFHIDSDGLATTIYCVNKGGSKWWVVIGPKDKTDTAAFASVENVYAFHNDGVNMAALGDVQVEAVLLRPGVRLYMRPDTPHAVLTPEASICHGGHYLTASNLRSTCYGFLMGFSLSTLLTNTTHTSACQLLFRKILAYFYHIYTKGRPEEAGPLESPVPHVPDPSTFNGIHDLFSLCNIVEMANILHPDSYHTGLSVSQRQEMIRGRFFSRAIVSWVISNYDIELVTTETFYWNYLAYQARAICHAKTFGDSREAYSYTGVPLANEVRALINQSFRGVDAFWEQWESFADVPLGTFAWPKDDLHSVKIRKPRVQAILGWNADGSNYNDIQWASERAARASKRMRLR